MSPGRAYVQVALSTQELDLPTYRYVCVAQYLNVHVNARQVEFVRVDMNIADVVPVRPSPKDWSIFTRHKTDFRPVW